MTVVSKSKVSRTKEDRSKARYHRLPTATVDDILSWRPCADWPREKVEDVFILVAEGSEVGAWHINALDILRFVASYEATARMYFGGDSSYLFGAERYDDLEWAACHLLPDDQDFKKLLDEEGWWWRGRAKGEMVFYWSPVGALRVLLEKWVKG